MKNVMKLLAGVLLASTVLISCDKDDEENVETKNYLKIGDTEYDLSSGILDNYGSDDDNSWHFGYNTDLTIFSEGLSLQKTEDNDWELVGKGHGVYFEMFSTTGASLDNGDYNFSSTEPSPIGTFDDGGYVVNYNAEMEDFEDEEGYEEDDMVSGKVSVSKSGSEYSITINCTSGSGVKITGFYKGTLEYFDWSDDSKSANLKSLKAKKGIIRK